MNTTYGRDDARMTHGMAILAMLVLHLFCRTGDKVFGKPLLWLTPEVPAVYLCGFFAEICVTVYSLGVGYAQMLMVEEGRSSYRVNLRRILRLMGNYWVVVVLFSIAGLLTGGAGGGGVPGSPLDFVKTLFLLHSYNGAWWYLHSYVLLLLLPPAVLLFPVKKLPPAVGLAGCFLLQVGFYLLARFIPFPTAVGIAPVDYLGEELRRLCSILPAVWAGACLCRARAVERLGAWGNRRFSPRAGRALLFAAYAILFAGYTLLHKAVLCGAVGVLTFLLFNLWKKSAPVRKIFLFLGCHSTNIWLTHMFFYVSVFPGLVQKAVYPIPMLLFLLALTVASSYVIKGVERGCSLLWRAARRHLPSRSC